MEGDKVGKLLRTLNDKIDDIMSKPPQLEEVTLPDGFSCYQVIKPVIKLSDLNYNYKDYSQEDNLNAVKEVVYVLNQFYKECGIKVKCQFVIDHDYEFIIQLP